MLKVSKMILMRKMEKVQKKRKNRNEAILGISLRSGQEDRNLVRDAAQRTQMLFTVRIVMEKLCH